MRTIWDSSTFPGSLRGIKTNNNGMAELLRVRQANCRASNSSTQLNNYDFTRTGAQVVCRLYTAVHPREGIMVLPSDAARSCQER